MCVLDHYDGRVDHGADGDGDTAERHDVGGEAHVVHGNEGDDDGRRQHYDGDQGAAEVEQEEEAHQADDDALLDQGLLQRVDGTMDELRPVVGRDNLYPFGERGLDFGEALLDAVDDVQRVFTIAHDDDATNYLALAVELRDAAAQVGALLHGGDVAQQDGRPPPVRTQRDGLEVGQRAHVAPPPHEVLPPGELDGAAAHVVVPRANGGDHSPERNLIGGQGVGIDGHLVLLLEPADAGDLGHAGDAFEPVSEVPVLEASQFGEVVVRLAARGLVGVAGRIGVEGGRALGGIEEEAPAFVVPLELGGAAGDFSVNRTDWLLRQRVLVDPTHAGGVGAQGRADSFGQAALHLVEILHDAAARPVHVGAIFEDNIHEREAEEGLASHHLHAGRAEEAGHDGIGDLVFHQIGAAPRPLG